MVFAQNSKPPLASQVLTNATVFSKNLSASDTTVQHALQTLDQMTSGGGSINWGQINGTLGNQGDLQSALNAKQPTTDMSVYALKTDLPAGYTDAQAKAAAGWSRSTPNVSLTTVTDNVGIGTTAPGYKLDVNGTGYFASNVAIGTTPYSYGGTNVGLTVLGTGTYGVLALKAAQPLVKWVGSFNSGDGAELYQNNSGSFLFNVTSGIYGFVILSDGSSQIGKQSASKTTFSSSVAPSSALGKVHITGNEATSTTNALYVENSTPTGLFVVRNDGNVGIGSVTPQATLDVEGSVYLGATSFQIVRAFTLGATVTAGQICYLSSSDGKMYLAKGDSATTVNGLVGIALVGGNANDSVKFLLHGDYTGSYTAGAPYYISVSTAGSITSTQPSTSTNVSRIIGYATSSTNLYFCPSNDYVTI